MRWIGERRGAIKAWIGPTWYGFLLGLSTAVLLGAICAGVAVLWPLPDPPPAVFHDLLQVGVGLLVAFSVATAAVRILDGETLHDHLAWLSFCSGTGVAGLGAIALWVALAAFLESGHSGALAQIGLGFVVGGLLLLGVIIALMPWLSFHWRDETVTAASRND